MTQDNDGVRIDATELTPEEAEEYGDLLADSLQADYSARIRELYMSCEYTTDEAGWQAIFARAWPEVLARNEIGRRISAMSRERRVERGGSEAMPPLEVDSEAGAAAAAAASRQMTSNTPFTAIRPFN